MCLVDTPEPPEVTPPPEYAQARAPDAGAARSTSGQRERDRARAGSSTVLTSGSGALNPAQTQKKTLLGQ